MDIHRIPTEKVRDLYNRLENMWGADHWHAHTKKWLNTYLRKQISLAEKATTVLHVGSAGVDYGLVGSMTCHVDVADKKLTGVPNAVIGDIHSLPIKPDSVDFCTCVGSVLNYCDAVVSLLQVSSVIKAGGHLVLEFETSESWEYFGSDVYNLGVTSTHTFYGGDPDCTLWIYSLTFIKEILLKHGFRVKDESRSHVLSSLIYRLTHNEKFSTKFASFDHISGKIPLLRRGASNVILLCQKSL
ncbi:MAG: hypothetical protein RSP_10030 [Rhodanobacter sp.]